MIAITHFFKALLQGSLKCSAFLSGETRNFFWADGIISASLFLLKIHGKRARATINTIYWEETKRRFSQIRRQFGLRLRWRRLITIGGIIQEIAPEGRLIVVLKDVES